MAAGHGGARVGSGRKRKSKEERRLSGNAGHRSNVVPHPSVPAASTKQAVELDEADAPDDLTLDERHIWMQLAPHAMAKGMLRPEWRLAFKDLCRNIVIMQRLAKSPLDAGGPHHRGMIGAVDRELLRFDLAPCGKRVVDEEPAAVDPMERKYFGSA